MGGVAILSRRIIVGIVTIGQTALGAGAQAQSYPEKPIRILTTTSGGPNDLTRA